MTFYRILYSVSVICKSMHICASNCCILLLEDTIRAAWIFIILLLFYDMLKHIVDHASPVIVLHFSFRSLDHTMPRPWLHSLDSWHSMNLKLVLWQRNFFSWKQYILSCIWICLRLVRYLEYTFFQNLYDTSTWNWIALVTCSLWN